MTSLALTRFLAPLVPLALLAACGGDSADEGDGRSATGEVLEGTISDDMLPLDQLQSEPPLLEPERAARPAGGSGGGQEAAATEEAEEPATEEDSASEPAAEPDED